MADITINYDVSPTGCAGGHHYTMTATIIGLGPDKLVNVEPPDLLNQPDNEVLKACLDTLTWILCKKYLADATHAEAKTLLDTKQIILDPQAAP